MIAGIGTDLCDVRRIEAAVSRLGDRFAHRILGETEQQVYAERRQAHAQRASRYLASRFAAKEAFAKAIGLGVRHPMNWHDCQVINDERGNPGFNSVVSSPAGLPAAPGARTFPCRTRAITPWPSWSSISYLLQHEHFQAIQARRRTGRP